MDFIRGKIYRLVAPSGKQYVGSTKQPRLSYRMKKHRADYRKWRQDGKRSYTSSFELFEEDYDGVVIELLESYPCNGIDELRKREGHWIRTIEGGCVNRRVAGRTQAESCAAWRAANPERVRAQNAEYYAANAERVLARKAEYRAANREHILARQAERVACECGAEVNRINLARHRRTAKHINATNAASTS